MQQHAENEIVQPTLLCDKKGNLNPAAIGYATKPLIDSNLSNHFMRKKKWNDWCIYGEDLLFSATIRHLDYVAICSVYIFQYETQYFFEKTITIPLGHKIKMSTRVLDTVILTNSEMSIHMNYHPHETHLSIVVTDFDGETLHAQLIIQHPKNDDTLNVVVPWNRQTFHFTAKHHTLPTKGFIKMGDKRFLFHEEESFAILHVGRGVWPREATWNLATASQFVRHQRIGLNFGGTWTDGTGMTENAIFVNGHMTKIHEDVLFNYDTTHYMKPWTVSTKFTDQVQLTFSPFFERVASTNIKLIKSEVHQLFGYYTGTIRLKNGIILPIKQLLGSIEKYKAKW